VSDVFISHFRDDAEEAICTALSPEAAGYTTWYYEKHSLPGPTYLAQTDEAIDECQAGVVVISPGALGSNQVTSEIVRAHAGRKHFVPLLHGIAHDEFQQRQPILRMALGASVSVDIPLEGVAAIVPRITAGLKAMGVEPGSPAKPKDLRISGPHVLPGRTFPSRPRRCPSGSSSVRASSRKPKAICWTTPSHRPPP